MSVQITNGQVVLTPDGKVLIPDDDDCCCGCMPIENQPHFFSSVQVNVSATCSDESGGTSGSSSQFWTREASPFGSCTIPFPGAGGPNELRFWLEYELNGDCSPCLLTDGVSQNFGFFDTDAQVGAIALISLGLASIAFVPNACGYDFTGWTGTGALPFTGPGGYSFSGYRTLDTGTTYSGVVTVG